MPRSIRLREDTWRRLEAWRERVHVQSYDEAIRQLLRRVNPPGSRFGAHPGMSPFEHGETGHEE